jgi:hypothetical protein
MFIYLEGTYTYILLQLHVGYDISPLSRVKFEILTTSHHDISPLKRVKLKNIITHMGN